MCENVMHHLAIGLLVVESLALGFLILGWFQAKREDETDEGK